MSTRNSAGPLLVGPVAAETKRMMFGCPEAVFCRGGDGEGWGCGWLERRSPDTHQVGHLALDGADALLVKAEHALEGIRGAGARVFGQIDDAVAAITELALHSQALAVDFHHAPNKLAGIAAAAAAAIAAPAHKLRGTREILHRLLRLMRRRRRGRGRGSPADGGDEEGEGTGGSSNQRFRTSPSTGCRGQGGSKAAGAQSFWGGCATAETAGHSKSPRAGWASAFALARAAKRRVLRRFASFVPCREAATPAAVQALNRACVRTPGGRDTKKSPATAPRRGWGWCSPRRQGRQQRPLAAAAATCRLVGRLFPPPRLPQRWRAGTLHKTRVCLAAGRQAGSHTGCHERPPRRVCFALLAGTWGRIRAAVKCTGARQRQPSTRAHLVGSGAHKSVLRGRQPTDRQVQPDEMFRGTCQRGNSLRQTGRPSPASRGDPTPKPSSLAPRLVAWSRNMSGQPPSPLGAASKRLRMTPGAAAAAATAASCGSATAAGGNAGADGLVSPTDAAAALSHVLGAGPSPLQHLLGSLAHAALQVRRVRAASG